MKVIGSVIGGIVTILFIFFFIVTFRLLIDDPSSVRTSAYAKLYEKKVYKVAKEKGVEDIYKIFLSIMIEESNDNRDTPNKMGAGYTTLIDPNGFYAGINQFIKVRDEAHSLGITDLYHIIQAYHLVNVNKSMGMSTDSDPDDEEDGIKSYLHYISILYPMPRYSVQMANNYVNYVKEYINDERKDAAKEEYKQNHQNGCTCHRCGSCTYDERLSELCSLHRFMGPPLLFKCNQCIYVETFVSRCSDCEARVSADASAYANEKCPLSDIAYSINAAYASNVLGRTDYFWGYVPGETEDDLPIQFGNMEQVVQYAQYYKTIGVTYVSPGSVPPHTFDCSSFTNYLYGKIGISIPNVAYLQYNNASLFHSMEFAKPGDLVFFKDTRTDGELRIAEDGTNITHVGIYIGGGRFIHASSGAGKVIESSFTSYYQQHFAAFGRYGN